MWRTSVLSLALLLLPCLAVDAQQVGSISGRVTDQTGQPLAGVQVVVQGSDLGSLSSNTGRYEISAVPTGEAVVVARALGYVPAQQTVTISAGAPATADFVLQVSAINLEEIVAVAADVALAAAIAAAARAIRAVVERAATRHARRDHAQPAADSPL